MRTKAEIKAEMEKPTYLGDGAYASFDGFQFWLAANHHTNNVIALGLREIAALNEYVERTKKLIGEYNDQTS